MNLSSLFFFLLLGPFIFPNSPPPIFGTQACVRVSVCVYNLVSSLHMCVKIMHVCLPVSILFCLKSSFNQML